MREDARDRLINISLGNLRLVERGHQVRGVVAVALEVAPALEGCGDGVLMGLGVPVGGHDVANRSAVRDDEAVPAPLPADNVILKLAVRAAGHAVDRVVCAEPSATACCQNGESRRYGEQTGPEAVTCRLAS